MNNVKIKSLECRNEYINQNVIYHKKQGIRIRHKDHNNNFGRSNTPLITAV